MFIIHLSWIGQNMQKSAKICREINTNYSKYEGKTYAVHISYGIDNKPYWYYFENHGYDNYNIYMRIEM